MQRGCLVGLSGSGRFKRHIFPSALPRRELVSTCGGMPDRGIARFAMNWRKAKPAILLSVNGLCNSLRRHSALKLNGIATTDQKVASTGAWTGTKR